MITVKLKSGEVKQVTRNVAFDLVDRGLAEVVTTEAKPIYRQYTHRQMRPATKTKFK